jgi:WD40 repeat protein
LRFRPDGGGLAIGVGGELRQLQVRDLPGCELVASRELDGSPFMVAWSADGTQIGLACGDYRGYLWEPGRDELRTVLEGHAAEVVEIHLSSSLPLAVTYSWDETTRVWDTETGEELVRISAPPIRVSADGRRMAAHTREYVGTWRLEHGGVLEGLRGHVEKSPRHVAISPDRRLLVSAGVDGALLWEVASSRLVRVLDTSRIDGLAFLPGGEGLLVCGSAGLQLRPLPALEPGVTLLEGGFTGLDTDARGEVAAVLGGEAILVVPLAEPERAVTISTPTAGISDVRLSPDARWVASQSFHGEGVRVWDAASGQQCAHLFGEEGTVTACFSPDGSVLATSTRADFRLWRTGRWDEVLRIPRRRPYAGGGEALAFTPDGARLAALDLSGTVTFFDARSGERRATLEPPSLQPISALSFSTDGTLLALACPTNSVQVWDLGEISRQLEALRLGRW